MYQLKKHRALMVTLVFILVMGLFGIASFLEFQRGVLVKKQAQQNDIYILTEKVNSLVNQSIVNAEGVVAFIKTYPELDQDEFAAYAQKSLSQKYNIISHYTAVKDTTIAFVFPYEGNASGIGVDLATIDGQKEQILKVRDENISLLVGPIELVQGGVRLINRMPIFVGNDYWGQLSLILKFEALLQDAGINDFSRDNFITIKQFNFEDDVPSLIYTNGQNFSKESIETSIEVPNGTWHLEFESKEAFTGFTDVFFLLLIIGFIIGILLAVLLRYLLITNENLNKLVDYRTESISIVNQELELSLEQLKTTQDQLIMREKHAALGELVAGVAHEINTPLGVCVTAVSYMHDMIKTLIDDLDEGVLKKSKLIDSFNHLSDSSTIIASNLDRASKLVSSFKKLSADQYFEEYRSIDLKEYMEYILHTVSPIFNKTTHEIKVDINQTVKFMSYPGALSQVFTNLLMNSIVHGFDRREKGLINIKANIVDNRVIIDYYDDGNGIRQEISDKVFNPFFTTRRDIGNTGLGMHIVFNIVHQQLKGMIQLLYDVDQGVHFRIILPYE